MRIATKVITAACLGALVAAAAAAAADWPQFRGPQRTGISAETGLLDKWPEGGPKLLWSVDGIGKGFSHVTVVGGLVYVTGMIEKDDGWLYCYTADGKLKWKQSYGKEWYTSHPGSRGIPTVHDGLIYVASGIGNVACFKADDGTPVWQVPLFEKYEAPQVKWGYAESPLIDGDKIFFTPCGKKGTMVALDRKTGKEVWVSRNLGDKNGFCSPLLVEHGGTRMLVTMTDKSVVAFSPADGSVIWRQAYESFRGNHPDTPIYHNGWLYVVSGYGKGATGYKLADDGKSVKQVWEQPKQDPCHGQAVLVDGYVYASSHQKGNGKWFCVKLATGEIAWEDAGVGKAGSVIAAGGMLYCYSEDGNVGLVKPNPAKCEIVSSFKVPKGDGPHWAHPVVANGRLYVRHGDALMCYDVARK